MRNDGSTLSHRRSRHERLFAPDLLAATGFAGFAVLAALAPAPVPGRPAVWLVVLVAVGVGGPLAVRRSWPVPVFWACLAVSVGAWPLGWGPACFPAVAYALYGVALTQPRRRRLPSRVLAAVLALVVLDLVFVGVPREPPVDTAAVILVVVAPGTAWLTGRVVRDRRLAAARSARQLAERAVAGERLRVARELHDVVTHSIGLIAVKASVANHVARERPTEVAESLRAIEAISRDALAELRSMLRLLRLDTDGEPGSGAVAAGLGPVPGVAGLGALADRVRAAGVDVELVTSGLDDVPAGVGLSVYRIAQESLTNVVKHAGAGRCRLDVEADGREVRIEVTDDGRAAGDRRPEPDGGHGLIGMRERTAMYGGALEAGPMTGGGYRVLARLPYGSAHRDELRHELRGR